MPGRTNSKDRIYWIVDPDERAITVLRLDGDRYVVHGLFTEGAAPSAYLPGFAVNVNEVWAAAA